MNSFSEYTDISKNVCLSTTISIILILLFIISPLSNFIIASFISKIIVLVILSYALYNNLKITQQFSKNTGIQLLSGDWSNIKSNVICSYIFSLFMILLIVTISKTFF